MHVSVRVDLLRSKTTFDRVQSVMRKSLIAKITMMTIMTCTMIALVREDGEEFYDPSRDARKGRSFFILLRAYSVHLHGLLRIHGLFTCLVCLLTVYSVRCLIAVHLVYS